MASQGMDIDEFSVKSLEAKTQCRLFSERCITMIAKHQYRLPEPQNQYDHDDEVLELSGALRELLFDKDPAIIAQALHQAINDYELAKEPAYLANMLAWMGLYLDSELLHREQLEHTQMMMRKSESAKARSGHDEDMTADE